MLLMRCKLIMGRSNGFTAELNMHPVSVKFLLKIMTVVISKELLQVATDDATFLFTVFTTDES